MCCCIKHSKHFLVFRFFITIHRIHQSCQFVTASEGAFKYCCGKIFQIIRRYGKRFFFILQFNLHGGIWVNHGKTFNRVNQSSARRNLPEIDLYSLINHHRRREVQRRPLLHYIRDSVDGTISHRVHAVHRHVEIFGQHADLVQSRHLGDKTRVSRLA